MAVQAMAGGRKPSRGSGGATPCRETTIGCGRDAGISGSRAAAPSSETPTGGRRLAFFAERKKCHTEIRGDLTNHFFLLTSSTGCLRPPSEDEQPINTSPQGGRQPPTSAHPSVGLRGLRPCVFPTPTSGARPLQAMPAASWSRLWRSLRPCGREYRLIRARRWPPRGWVRRAPRRGLVGVLRLRETLWRSIGHG